MYESCCYTDLDGAPVAVVTATGKEDVGRLILTLHGAPPVVELLQLGDRLKRQTARRAGGRAALRWLDANSGSNFAVKGSPTDPAGLGTWLEARAEDTILISAAGNAWQLASFADEEDEADEGRFLMPALGDQKFEITDPHALAALAELAPFYDVTKLADLAELIAGGAS